MPGTDRATGPRQRDVDRLVDQHSLVALGLEHRLALLQRRRDVAAGLPDELSGALAVRWVQPADAPVQQRERRPVAGVLGARSLELVQGFGLPDGREGSRAVLLDLIRRGGAGFGRGQDHRLRRQP